MGPGFVDCFVRLGLFALRSLRHCTAAVFLTQINFRLKPSLICSSSAASKGQQADHSNENKFHFCSPSKVFFLALNISGGKTSKSDRKKIPALLLILKTLEQQYSARTVIRRLRASIMARDHRRAFVHAHTPRRIAVRQRSATCRLNMGSLRSLWHDQSRICSTIQSSRPSHATMLSYLANSAPVSTPPKNSCMDCPMDSRFGKAVATTTSATSSSLTK